MGRKKHFLQMGKQVLCIAAVSAMTITSVPWDQASAAEQNEQTQNLIKAGSLPATEDTMTIAQPFATGTGGSYSFRIPCLISLKNGEHKGNLVAAADARYETPGDGGGLDSIASVSTDMGETWNYSFPIWFPDSEGYASKNATTVIDPVLVEGTDGTIYCAADVNPTGITTHYAGISEGTGFVDVNGKMRIALTDTYANASSNPATDTEMTKYAYYVGDFQDGYAPVRNRSDDEETDWRVDEWYNIEKKENGVYQPLIQKQVNSDKDIQQNVFYAASELHVFNIGYIWMVESKDGGKSWENPRILNDQIKAKNGENAILVCPGKGITSSDDVIMIPFYSQFSGVEKASFIYSKDKGKTWKRTNNVTHLASAGRSSESEIVELSDGTLRMFSRTGKNEICYTDAIKDENGEYSMGEMVSTGVSCWSNCKVTAIRYSKKVDGKDLVLVVSPNGPGSRSNGQIYSFKVNDNKTMTLLNRFDIKDPDYDDSFGYSCIAELQDGTVGILWEPSTSGYIGNDPYALLYHNYHIKEVVPNSDVEIEGVTENPPTRDTARKIALEQGAGYTVKAENVSIENGNSDAISITPADAYFLCDSKTSTAANTSAAIENAWMTFTEGKEANTWRIKNEFINHYLTNSDNYQIYYMNPIPEDMQLEKIEQGAETVFRIKNNDSGNYICYTNGTFDRMPSYNASWTGGTYDFILLREKDEVSDSDLIPGYERVSEPVSGERYLITCSYNGDLIVFYPYAEDCASWAGAGTIWNDSKRNRVKFFKKDIALVKQNTITGLVAGETVQVRAGDTLYNIQVKEPVSKEAVGNVFSSAKQRADAYLQEGQGDYSGETWNALRDVCKDIQNAADNLSVPEMKSLIEKLDTAKGNLYLIDRAAEESKAEASIKNAESDYAVGETKYTKESYAAFKVAYEALQNAILEVGGKVGAEELQKLYQDLEKAQKALKEKEKDNETKDKYEEGKSYVVGDYSYKIISLSGKTVAVDGLKNASLKKVNVISAVTIGNDSYKVIAVADSAFSKCAKITNVTIAADIETIENNAFSGCKNLKKVTVNSTKLKSIGKKAFYNCKKLKNITLKTKQLTKIDKTAFKKIHKSAAVKVPKNKYNAYKKRFKGVKFKK